MKKYKYKASSIKILDGISAIRKRPSIYIGNISSNYGLHKLFFETLDNSIDEFLSGFCKKIDIIFHLDNSVSVIDDGRGIPIDIKFDDKNLIKRSAAEIVMTELHSGSKFNKNIYKISSGLHGLGISCVNALSKKLTLIVNKKKKKHKIKFIKGISQNKIFNIFKKKSFFLNIISNTNTNGTEIRFLFDNNIFKKKKFNYKIIKKRIIQLLYLNKGININVLFERLNKKKIFYLKGGLKNFIKYINKKKNVISSIFKIKFNKLLLKYKFSLNLVLQWCDTFKEKLICFTNNIFQKEGGVHLTSLKYSITNVIKKYIKEKNLLKNNNIEISGKDIRRGLTCILSLKLLNPKFNSQTKDKLISSELKNPMCNIIKKKLFIILNKNKFEFKKICYRIIKLKENKYIKKKLKYFKNFNNDLLIYSNDKRLFSFSEIYIVEGDSAGGSVRQCMNRNFQSVFSLKGKILNVEKSSLSRLVSSKEIISLINTLGLSIEEDNNNKLSNLKYKKIIIMTDADIDGSHIRTLLLTLFYKYFNELIYKGYIYIARPPLYKINFNKFNFYFQNKKEESFYINKISIKNSKLSSINKKLKDIKFNKIKFFINKYIFLKNINKYIYSNFKKYVFNIILNKLNLNLDNIFKLNKFFKKYINFLKKKNINFIYYKKKISIKSKFFKDELIIINNRFINNFDYQYFMRIIIDLNNIISKKPIVKKYINKKFIFNKIFNIYQFIKWMIFETKKYISTQRYKGLGEMNPKQLWDTTMDPDKRKLFKVKIKNKFKTNKLFKILMGNKIDDRKIFIKSNMNNL